MCFFMWPNVFSLITKISLLIIFALSLGYVVLTYVTSLIFIKKVTNIQAKTFGHSHWSGMTERAMQVTYWVVVKLDCIEKLRDQELVM